MTSTVPAHTPPEQVTDEATRQGLQLAREAGAAYRHMVEYFIAHVAVSGQKQAIGEYEVGLAVEHAEPLYYLMGGQLKLAEPPADANAHLEVVVMDGADGRFIPELTVFVTVRSSQGDEIGTFHLPFLWHPTMYHYGANVHIPGNGEYAMTVAIAAPTFPRHDETNGKRYGQSVVAEFSGVTMTVGRK